MTWDGKERRTSKEQIRWWVATLLTVLIPFCTLVYLYGRLNERVDNLKQGQDEMRQELIMLIGQKKGP